MGAQMESAVTQNSADMLDGTFDAIARLLMNRIAY